MDPAYVVKYAELYRRHWWWRSREKLTLKWLEQLKPESGFGLILDVGSGSGLFLEALSRFGQPEGVEADGAWAKHPTPGAGAGALPAVRCDVSAKSAIRAKI